MFGRVVQAPIQAVDREWVEESFAWFADQFGVSLLASPVLLPTSEYFPGPFTGEPAQMRALVTGVAAAMGVESSRLTVAPFPRDGGAVAEHGLKGCIGYPGGSFRGGEERSLITPLGEERSLIALDKALVDRPIALVATIAHMLGHIRFAGVRRVPLRPGQQASREWIINLFTVYAGLGIFSANAAVEVEAPPRANQRAAQAWGSNAGRYRHYQSGYLTEEHYGYALACLALMRGEMHPKWSKHLDTNPRVYMGQSLKYLAEHPPAPLLDIRSGPTAK